ncbi:MAG: SDR family NAD(P)-dependent oxidoreductase, partial [Planctomycetota bacterium]
MKTIVTGASKGIGRGIARVLAGAGFPVGLLARSGDELEALREEIRAAGGEAHVAVADLRDREQATEAVEALMDKLGGIDAL